MTGEPHDKERRDAEALAFVCTHLQQLRRDLLRGSREGAASLERLRIAARNGAGIRQELEELHACLRGLGDTLGIFGHVRGAAPPDGIDRSTQPEIVYVCPERRCTRHWWPSPEGEPPLCAVDAMPLRRERM